MNKIIKRSLPFLFCFVLFFFSLLLLLLLLYYYYYYYYYYSSPLVGRYLAHVAPELVSKTSCVWPSSATFLYHCLRFQLKVKGNLSRL